MLQCQTDRRTKFLFVCGYLREIHSSNTSNINSNNNTTINHIIIPADIIQIVTAFYDTLQLIFTILGDKYDGNSHKNIIRCINFYNQNCFRLNIHRLPKIKYAQETQLLPISKNWNLSKMGICLIKNISKTFEDILPLPERQRLNSIMSQHSSKLDKNEISVIFKCFGIKHTNKKKDLPNKSSIIIFNSSKLSSNERIITSNNKKSFNTKSTSAVINAYEIELPSVYKITANHYRGLGSCSAIYSNDYGLLVSNNFKTIQLICEKNFCFDQKNTSDLATNFELQSDSKLKWRELVEIMNHGTAQPLLLNIPSVMNDKLFVRSDRRTNIYTFMNGMDFDGNEISYHNKCQDIKIQYCSEGRYHKKTNAGVYDQRRRSVYCLIGNVGENETIVEMYDFRKDQWYDQYFKPCLNEHSEYCSMWMEGDCNVLFVAGNLQDLRGNIDSGIGFVEFCDVRNSDRRWVRAEKSMQLLYMPNWGTFRHVGGIFS